jgi:hypothetical protein
MPASHKWNLFFQQYVTRSLELSGNRFEMRLDACQRHLDNMWSLRPDRTSGFTALEVGTGWYPVVPLGLFLCGASEVWSFDIAPLLSLPRLQRVFARFDEYARSGALHKHLPGVWPERLERLRQAAARAGFPLASPSASVEPEGREATDGSPTAVLAELNIHVQVRGADHTGLPLGSIDLFASTSVLQYIPRETLKSILAEFKRIGTPYAAQSHYLNLVDQYSYFDKSISPLNFLRYSNRQWKYLNSPLTWLNRLRISDYRILFAEAGFEITKENSASGSPGDLEKIQLAPEFQHYSQQNLLVIYSWLVAQPVGSCNLHPPARILRTGNAPTPVKAAHSSTCHLPKSSGTSDNRNVK